VFTIACCLVVGLRLGLGLGLDLVGKLLCTRICATLGCNCHGPPSSGHHDYDILPDDWRWRGNLAERSSIGCMWTTAQDLRAVNSGLVSANIQVHRIGFRARQSSNEVTATSDRQAMQHNDETKMTNTK